MRGSNAWSTARATGAVLVVILGGCTTGPGVRSPESNAASQLHAQQAEYAASISEQCESLLSGLTATRPLLQSLESSLNSQIDRIEQASRSLETQQEPPAAPVECSDENADGESKSTIGAIEWIHMSPPDRSYRARIDSGAETSSLSASAVVAFERDGEDWVRFSFDHDGSEDVVELELPVVRTVLIRQASSAEPERRIVVEIDVRFGEHLQTTQFTLTDRSHMTYPVLLGRAFLMDLYVVDVAKSYTRPRHGTEDS